MFPYNDTEVIDSDPDGIGDSVDTDDDNDGYNDTEEDLPLNPNEHQYNDGDGIGNNADLDDDNDGFNDTTDSFPLMQMNQSILIMMVLETTQMMVVMVLRMPSTPVNLLLIPTKRTPIAME